MSAPPQFVLREAGLRDALQLPARPVTTAFKCDWSDAAGRGQPPLRPNQRRP